MVLPVRDEFPDGSEGVRAQAALEALVLCAVLVADVAQEVGKLELAERADAGKVL